MRNPIPACGDILKFKGSGRVRICIEHADYVVLINPTESGLGELTSEIIGA